MKSSTLKILLPATSGIILFSLLMLLSFKPLCAQGKSDSDYTAQKITVINENLVNTAVSAGMADLIYDKLSGMIPGDSLKNTIPSVSEIINKTVKKGIFQRNKLKTIRYDSYENVVIRAGLISGIRELMDVQDTSEHGIAAISESESITYLNDKDLSDMTVYARRQTSFLKKLMANPLMLNLFKEDIDLGTLTIPGPLNEANIRKYKYKLDGIEYEKGMRVFRIKTELKSGIVPGFEGFLYIYDSSFTLKKSDVKTNKATNIYVVNTIRLMQEYGKYHDSTGNEFTLPSGLNARAYGSVMELVRFIADYKTVVKDYGINKPVHAGVFDDFDVQVTKDADKPKNDYWAKWDYIKSKEEKKAFDELSKVKQKKPAFITFGGSTIGFGSRLSLSIPKLYHFNRAEGHVPMLSFTYDMVFGKYKINAMVAYGTSDYLWKYDVNTKFELLKNRSLEVSAGIYDNTMPLHKKPNDFIYLMNDIYTLFTHKDKMNYYRTRGYFAEVSKSFLNKKLTFTFKYREEKQESTQKNTEYSFFRTDAIYADMPPINEGLARNIGVRVKVDLNDYKYTDWGDDDITIRSLTLFPVIVFDYDNSGRKLGSDFEYKRYSLSMAGYSNIFSWLNLNYKVGAVSLLGNVPYQMLASLEQKFFGYPKDLYFIVCDYGEFFGDVAYYMNIENNFGKFFPFNVPVLRKLTLLGFFGAGYTSARQETRDYSAVHDFGVTKGWYTEFGFGVANLMDIGYLRMGYRLSNFVNNNNSFLAFDMGL